MVDAIEKYKLRTIVGLREQIEHGDTSTETAMSAAFVAVYWLTCDTDVEFHGLSQGWWPLFKGTASIFAVNSSFKGDQMFQRRRKTLNDSLPDGQKFFAQLEKIYIGHVSNENVGVYKATAMQLSRLIEKFTASSTNENNIKFVGFWIIVALSQDFVTLVNEFDPAALTLLAIFFASVSSQSQWLLSESSWSRYLRIKEKIPAFLHHHLDISYTGLTIPYRHA